MKKKTKELLVKLGIAMATIAGSAFLLFGKKKDKKEIKKNNDKELFI